ncbi:MAG: lipopolysaccharide biosynthesis protein [Oscillospiraceae bacterium]|nr:lipopolysaccharide biosynthesis protein [Oscillospiraceae bacterium]
MEKNTIVRSLAYKFTERFAVKGLGFVISIVLARLLAPEVFGQVALLTVFTDLSLTLIDSGLSTALVQTRKADERDYSTVFVITLALSCVMIGILQLTAPAIARYFRSEELLRPLRFFSFSLLLSAFNSIQVARMQREMRFREMMFCNLAATVLAGSLGVYLAFRGAGLWALVGYFFAQIAVSSLAMLSVLRWFPRERFSLESAKRLYGFGLKMLAASIVTTVYNNLRPLIIGRRFSTAELGYFNRGQTFASTVSLNLDAAIQSVMFPVLSRAQDEPEALLALLRRTKKLGCFLIFPVMFGMAAAAEPIVRVVLTDKWLPAVPFLILMSVGEAQVPLTSANLVALKSLGRSDLYARQEVLRRVLMLLVLAVSVLGFRTVPAIAAGFAFSAWLDAWVTSLPLKKLLGYGPLDQARDVWKSLLSALLMAGAVRAIGLLPLPPALKLFAQILFGIAVYLLINRLLGNESLLYMLSLLQSRRPNPEETP